MIAIAMTGHLRPILYTHITPPSPSDCLPSHSLPRFPPPPLLHCFFSSSFFPILIISTDQVYGMCSSGAVSTLCFVWKFSCITFHSLIHAYIYNACNLISIHQQLSKDQLLDRFLYGCPQGNRLGKMSSSNFQDEAPTPLPVAGPLFILPLLFHLSRVLLGAWRFGLFRCVYSSFHNQLDLIREPAFY